MAKTLMFKPMKGKPFLFVIVLMLAISLVLAGCAAPAPAPTPAPEEEVISVLIATDGSSMSVGWNG